MLNLYPMIKFGESENVKKLAYNGEIFFNSPNSYKGSWGFDSYTFTPVWDDYEKGFFDSNEGGLATGSGTRIGCYPGVNIFDRGFKFPNYEPNFWLDGGVIGYTHNYCQFSLYTIKLTYQLENSIDNRMYEKFGNTCAFIRQPYEFLKRIYVGLAYAGLGFKMNYINYVNNCKYIHPFEKDLEFSYQNEFRVLVILKNYDIKSVLLRIGNLQDIVDVISVDSLKKYKFAYNL